MKTEKFERLESLVSALIDERLEHQERNELNFILRDDAACRQQFLELMDVQSGMASLSGTPEVTPSVDWNQVANEAWHAPAQLPAPSSKVSRILPWMISLSSLAATVVLSLYLYQTSQLAVGPSVAPSTPKSVAEKVRVKDFAAAEFFGGELPVKGSPIALHQEYTLTAGMILLGFPNGAEAIFEAPSVFELRAIDRVMVSLGSCSVHAPDGAEGFRVDTPQTEVVDLGTRFSVTVNEVGQTDVQVVEGAAEVRPTINQSGRPSDANVSVLTEGQAKRYATGDTDGTAVHFRAGRYRSLLPDRVVSYHCVEQEKPYAELAEVTVQRAGKARRYSVDDLIRINVIHFTGSSAKRNVAIDDRMTGAITDCLNVDDSLITGFVNPGGSVEGLTTDPVLMESTERAGVTPTPGLGFTFAQPVINGPGPDVVLFELQAKVYPARGDGFFVSPLRFSPGLRSHWVEDFDITMRSDKALPLKKFQMPVFPNPDLLLKYRIGDQTETHMPTFQFYALAVAIDLSDLGYAEGAAVEGLFLHDDQRDQHEFDPVFIAGLPHHETTQEFKESK